MLMKNELNEEKPRVMRLVGVVVALMALVGVATMLRGKNAQPRVLEQIEAPNTDGSLDAVVAQMEKRIAAATTEEEAQAWRTKLAQARVAQDFTYVNHNVNMGPPTFADMTNPGLTSVFGVFSGCTSIPYLSKHVGGGSSTQSAYAKIVGLRVYFNPDSDSISGIIAYFSDETTQTGGNTPGTYPYYKYITQGTAQKLTGVTVTSVGAYVAGLEGLFDDNNLNGLAPYLRDYGNRKTMTFQASQTSTLAIEDVAFCLDATGVIGIQFYYGFHP